MGNPGTCGYCPDQPPLALPKGPSRHRQSRSISSLPLEKLGRINLEKRASVSAHSSPARAALVTELEKRQSIASFLGQDSPASRSTTEIATELDRKPSSFNPFRGTAGAAGSSATSGHRRVGSGSSIGSKATWDYSPRARFGAASPKKLDKYAVAKIAASLFHAPSKLERSLSMSRASSARDGEKQRNHGLTVGEVILPQSLREISSFLQRKGSASAEDGRLRTGSRTAAMAESAISQAPTAPSTQDHDITKPEEEAGAPPVTLNSPGNEIAAEIPYEEFCPEERWSSSSASSRAHTDSVPDSPTASIAALFEDESSLLDNRSPSEPSDLGDLRLCDNAGSYEPGPSSSPTAVGHVPMQCQDLENRTTIRQPSVIATDKITTEEELTEAALRCSISRERDDDDDDRGPAPVTESEPRARRRARMIRVVSTPRELTQEESGAKKMSGLKTMLRKRRRSVSASGIGAMLLRVVQVPESGAIVAKRFAESAGGEEAVEQAWRDWLHAPEKAAVEEEAVRRTDARDARDAPVVSQTTTEPEDAVEAIYSKFVDIEIEPGLNCVELVQHIKDIARDTNMDDVGQQQEQRASSENMLGNSPKHLLPGKTNSRSVCDGKSRRKTKTIRRGRMKSYHVDGMKEHLKVTDSFAALAQADTTTDTPAAAAAAEEEAAADEEEEEEEAAETAPLPPLPPTMGLNRSIRERSLTFISRLQAPSTATFSYVNMYQPCSVSVLSNPSFSSSHQDKLWEEQAEFYSSGGRGTPGRDTPGRDTPGRDEVAQEDEAAPISPTSALLLKLQRSPLPVFGSTGHQGYNNSSVGRSGLNGMRSPSESGHFMQQIMSRIRGSSPKSEATATRAGSSYPKSHLDKRRNPWTSCMCFSVKS